jgi:hypothetical protein
MSSAWSMTCGSLTRAGTAGTQYDALLAGCAEIEAVSLVEGAGVTIVARLSIDGAEPMVVRMPPAEPEARMEQVSTALEQLREMWTDNHLATDGLTP